MNATGLGLSLRSFAQFGSAISVFGLMQMRGPLSVLDVELGSMLSLRSFARSPIALTATTSTQVRWCRNRVNFGC